MTERVWFLKHFFLYSNKWCTCNKGTFHGIGMSQSKTTNGKSPQTFQSWSSASTTFSTPRDQLCRLNHIFNVESTICLKLDLFCGFSRQNCNLTHSSDGVKMPGFLFWNRSTCSLILNTTGRYAISPFLLSCITVWYSLNKMFISF